MRNRNRSRQQPCTSAIDEASVLANLSALMGSSPLRLGKIRAAIRRYGARPRRVRVITTAEAGLPGRCKY